MHYFGDELNAGEQPSGLAILARQLPLMDDLRKLGIRYEPDYPGRAENDRELIRLGVESEATIRERRNSCRNN
jgi:hypothetical protein